MTGSFRLSIGRPGSLRRQLILWNVLALALLLAVLGVVIRVTAQSFLIRSVDLELEKDLRRSPPPPPGGFGPHRNGGARHDELGQPVWHPNLAGSDDIHPKQQHDLRKPNARNEVDAPSTPGVGLGDPGRGGPGGFGGRRSPWQDNPYFPHHFGIDGRSIMRNDTRPLWDAAGFALAKRGQAHIGTVLINGEALRVASAPVFKHGSLVYVVQTAYPLADINRAMAGIDRALLTLIPIGLLCAGVSGAYLTDRVLRRVRRTTQAAASIEYRDFAARLPVSGSDEFSELAETFNGLLGRLEAAYRQQQQLLEQQRRFTADASHELKTPLTVIKGTASMALGGIRSEESYKNSLRAIDCAADSMSHLVQDLLLLARSDAGQLGRNRILLPVREVLERAVSGTPISGVPVTIDVEDEALCVEGNESELARLFANLLDNAARHTPAHGSIHVRATTASGRVTISISDTGSGIAPEHLPHLGERFYRADAARARPDGGTGLGLSICKGIAEAHDGGLFIESEVGRGTTVHVLLPEAP